MPHYADGQLAKIGDHVVGRGYNVKEAISGIVVGVIEDSESCNLRVAFLKPSDLRKAHPTDSYNCAKPLGLIGGCGHTIVIDHIPLDVGMEYGDTKGFSKIE